MTKRSIPVCSHGVPRYKRNVRCLDCEIEVEKRTITTAEHTATVARENLRVLEAELAAQREAGAVLP